MPGHSWLKVLVEIGFPKLSGSVDILKSVVVELLSIPVSTRSLFNQRMLMSIPSTVANIETPHKSYLLVNHYHFLMMAPKLRYSHVRMSVHFYVLVKTLHVFLNVLRIVIYQEGLHEHDYENLNAPLGKSAQYSIESVLLVVNVTRSFEQKVWSNHPACNANLFFGLHQFIVEIFIITASVAVHLAIAVLSYLSETVEPILTDISIRSNKSRESKLGRIDFLVKVDAH